MSDKLFSETDDVDEFTRNTGSVKLSSINRQDIQNVSEAFNLCKLQPIILGRFFMTK